jgi:nucleotide-binding universal stress UspA family protein
MIAAGERPAGRRLIMVGVDDFAEAEAAAKWAVREAELRRDDVLLVNAYQVPLLPRQDKPAASLGWKADYPDIAVETLLLAGSPRDTVLRCRQTYSCWSSAAHIAAASGPGGSVQWLVLCSIGPAARLRSCRSSALAHRQRTS